jgi:hypothetical protein
VEARPHQEIMVWIFWTQDDVEFIGKIIGSNCSDCRDFIRCREEVFAQLEGHSGDKVDQIIKIGSRVVPNDLDAEFFVAFTDPIVEMYFFQKEKAGLPRCERMYGCYPIGDVGNPAYYWVIRNCEIDQTVAEMVRVGAIAVITGAKVNSAIIQDLEVATFDKKGLRIWERDEARALKTEIEELDGTFGKALINRQNRL